MTTFLTSPFFAVSTPHTRASSGAKILLFRFKFGGESEGVKWNAYIILNERLRVVFGAGIGEKAKR